MEAIFSKRSRQSSTVVFSRKLGLVNGILKFARLVAIHGAILFELLLVDALQLADNVERASNPLHVLVVIVQATYGYCGDHICDPWHSNRFTAPFPRSSHRNFLSRFRHQIASTHLN